MNILKSILLIALIFSFNTYSESSQKIEFLNLQAMIDFVKPYLPYNPVILEAGAFDGAETIKMKNVWPNSTIYTFEPVPELYNKLTKNLNGFSGVHCFPFALSDKNGLSTFYLSEDSNNPNIVSMSSSLLQPKDHLITNPDILFKKQIEVPTITLRDWSHLYDIPRIDFLWLDMQGYELNALKAASKRFINDIKVIITEVEFRQAYKDQYLYEDVKTWLESEGFTMVGRNFDIPATFWFGDAIFVRKS